MGAHTLTRTRAMMHCPHFRPWWRVAWQKCADVGTYPLLSHRKGGRMEQDFHHFSPSSSFVAEVAPMSSTRPRVGASTNDQRFLLVFVLGNFFGPDIRSELPRKSSLQRRSMGLPSYTSQQLAGSLFKLSEIESIYYFVLRLAHPSSRVKLQSLYKFLQGSLAAPVKETLEDHRQFPDLFPPHLHRHLRYKGTYKVIENLAFICNPDTSFIKPEHLDRFRRLSGLSSLSICPVESRNFQHGHRPEREEELQARYCAIAAGHVMSKVPVGVFMGDDSLKRRKTEPMDVMPFSMQEEEKPQWVLDTPMGSGMPVLPYPSTPEKLDGSVNSVKPAIVFTGTAATRQTGPVIGSVDIGVSDDAYLFRVALPGVKKDEGVFSCHVESDGRVVIKGVTNTGGQIIHKDSHTFHMLTQCLCPPGPFSLAFHLPVPVEPNDISGVFGSDGIFEAVVMKQKQKLGYVSVVFED